MKKSLTILLILTTTANATELVHKFSNPSFSGINQSAHYLTIDEQERTRKEKLRADAQEALEEAQREAENTTLAKFLRNLESRIYSTLAKDISEQLNERISLAHIAESRDIFANGALKAASWGQDKEPGLYTMQDVLGF